MIFAVKLCSALNGQAVIYLHDPACYFAVWQTHWFRFSSHFSALRRCLFAMPAVPNAGGTPLLEAACIGCKSPQQNHRKTGGTTWMHSERLLVYITMVTMENHHFHGKIHYKWWLSIVIGILYLAWCPWKNTSTKESAANLPEPGGQLTASGSRKVMAMGTTGITMHLPRHSKRYIHPPHQRCWCWMEDVVETGYMWIPNVEDNMMWYA